MSRGRVPDALTQRGFRPASVRHRFAALGVELSAVGVIGVSGACLAVVLAGVVPTRVGDDDTGQGVWQRGYGRLSRLGRAWVPHSRQLLIVEWASRGALVASRNWRSPGMRLVRLRYVHAGDGTPVSLGSAIVVELGREGSRRLAERVVAPLTKLGERQDEAQRSRLAAIEPELQQLKQLAATDPPAALKAQFALYRQHRITLWPLVLVRAPRMAAGYALLFALAKPGQTTIERLAGTIFVIETT